jgi:hypothetical protein
LLHRFGGSARALQRVRDDDLGASNELEASKPARSKVSRTTF